MTGRSQVASAVRAIHVSGAALVCAAVAAAGWLTVDGAAMAAPAPAEQSRSAATNVSPESDAGLDALELEIRAIEHVLDRYSTAFSTLNARAAVEVWPTVDQKALARAFESLDGQNVSFHDCQIATAGVRAEVACTGTARYVPKVGYRGRRPEPHRWSFSLHKANDEWLIDRVEARAVAWHEQ